ncbi:granulysin [Opisthocomus hoazin]|uniref:granulysin n=1 Tax=Opisthocomus hoazin TaxID=30419 RepID=UPI003F5355A6
MAAAFILALVAVGAARAAVPEPCHGDPMSWCRDTASAARCRREQDCQHLRDSPATGNVADGKMAAGDTAASGRGKKCGLCTKILARAKAMAGEEPDEAAVDAALGKVCRALGRRLGRLCRGLVKRYRERIRQALSDGAQPRAACAALGFCEA